MDIRYQYDIRGQLLEERRNGASVHYMYDAAGNRIDLYFRYSRIHMWFLCRFRIGCFQCGQVGHMYSILPFLLRDVTAHPFTICMMQPETESGKQTVIKKPDTITIRKIHIDSEYPLQRVVMRCFLR